MTEAIHFAMLRPESRLRAVWADGFVPLLSIRPVRMLNFRRMPEGYAYIADIRAATHEQLARLAVLISSAPAAERLLALGDVGIPCDDIQEVGTVPHVEVQFSPRSGRQAAGSGSKRHGGQRAVQARETTNHSSRVAGGNLNACTSRASAAQNATSRGAGGADARSGGSAAGVAEGGAS